MSGVELPHRATHNHESSTAAPHHVLISDDYHDDQVHLDDEPRRHNNRRHDKNIIRALVIGAGVVGLTTALRLLEDEHNLYEVTVIAKDFPSDTHRITSQIAGALWEWPPAVCGAHTNAMSLERSKKWCMISYERFKKMANRGVPGVHMSLANFLFFDNVDDTPYQKQKKDEIVESCVLQFTHNKNIIKDLGISSNYGIQDAYQYLAPIIDTDTYMQWLLFEVSKNPRARLFKLLEPLQGDLRGIEDTLLDLYKVDVIINCTGLGSKELANDPSVYPLRGALIRVKNTLKEDNGQLRSLINQAICVSLDGRNGKNDMIFIVPRNASIVVLGGLVEEGHMELELTMENYTPLSKMYERNIELFPMLKDMRIDEKYPIAIGVRPARRDGPCVKHVKGTHIIHNYGHGGSGFTLSFGCAEEVANILSTNFGIKQE